MRISKSAVAIATGLCLLRANTSLAQNEPRADISLPEQQTNFFNYPYLVILSVEPDYENNQLFINGSNFVVYGITPRVIPEELTLPVLNATKDMIIAEFPSADSSQVGLPIGYRKITSGSHRIIYRCTDRELIVVRVIHAGEDVPEIEE